MSILSWLTNGKHPLKEKPMAERLDNFGHPLDPGTIGPVAVSAVAVPPPSAPVPAVTAPNVKLTRSIEQIKPDLDKAVAEHKAKKDHAATLSAQADQAKKDVASHAGAVQSLRSEFAAAATAVEADADASVKDAEGFFSRIEKAL